MFDFLSLSVRVARSDGKVGTFTYSSSAAHLEGPGREHMLKEHAWVRERECHDACRDITSRVQT